MSGGEFAGTARFEILSRLGAGGMGVVYEALDRETSTRVALKTLRANNAETLLRFKEEFRGLQYLTHPNLVSLGELIEQDGVWFFTMELVDGMDFVRFVRPRGRLEAPRLRLVLPQLCYALQGLHAVHKVHRDIKPSNILVSAAGRLVLLDFGFLADEVGRNTNHHTTDGIVVGTADYMAPEQAAGDAVTAAADWYAVGVLVYRALTGRLPYSGSRVEVLTRKQQVPPPPIATLVNDAPADLVLLSEKLMAVEIADRADGRMVLSVLGVDHAAAPRQSAIEPSDATPFVGRQPEMAQLHDAFLQVQRGRSVTVYLTGESGVGKSALLGRFTTSIEQSTTRSVVLRGRCHERESVPYKAVDGIVDALARYLRAQTTELVAAVLPLNIGQLAQIFPTLRRVPAIAKSPPSNLDTLDPLEQRRRVFGAMRELLARLADRRPLVVAIEDLQWVDADSLSLLREVMQPPDEPPLLLLASARTNTGLSPMAALESVPGFSVGGASADVRSVHVTGLPAPEARELAALLLRQAGGEVQVGADAIAEEASGHPLFIDELVQHTLAVGGASAALPHLEGALWTRIGRLGEVARRVLAVVAVAGAPLRQDDAAAAAGLEFGAYTDTVAKLRAAKLTRTTGTGRGDEIEPYHGRVRDAVIEHSSADEISDCHRRIAVALEGSSAPDPEALAHHWYGGHDPERAGYYAELAAARAADALAFDRAARLYRASHEWRPVEGAFGRRLLTRLGDALANAGRGAEAARAYLDAAEGSSVAARLELTRMAADQLLRSGHVDEGLSVLGGVLRFAGVPLSEATRASRWAATWARAWLGMRGLAFRARDTTQVTLEELTRIDLLWTAASGLAYIDPQRGAAFQTRHLLTALGAGEPVRVSRALSAQALYAAGRGVRGRRRTDRLRARGDELAERAGTDHARGLALLSAGAAAAYEGRWADAVGACDEAEVLLRERCTNAWWELTSVQVCSQTALAMAGRLDDLANRLPRRLREAQERGDLYAATSLRVGLPCWLRLAADDPVGAGAELDDAIRSWSREGFHVQHAYELIARVDIALYAGEPARAREILDSTRAALEASRLQRVELVRVLIAWAAGRAALAVGDVVTARRSVRALGRERAPWAVALATLMSAELAPIADAATRLKGVAAAFDGLGMPLHGAVARRRRGELLGGDRGRELIDDADAWLYGERVDRPALFASVLAPPRG